MTLTVDPDVLERPLRGAYGQVPAKAAGLCAVCSAPTSGPQYERCTPCDRHARSGLRLAADVVPLMWAPKTAVGSHSGQGYQDLWSYKTDGADPSHAHRLRYLLYLAVAGHRECLAPNQRERPLALAHVPSTTGRASESHPIVSRFLSMFGPEIPRVVPTYVGGEGEPRVLRPSAWQLDATQLQGAKRVLLIEDTWVTGSRSQSVASAFADLGVGVRIVVLGRALDPTRTDQGNYLRAHPRRQYDRRICPVHRDIH